MKMILLTPGTIGKAVLGLPLMTGGTTVGLELVVNFYIDYTEAVRQMTGIV